MQTEHTLWVERYRPTDLDTYIGNEQLKQKVEVYLESGDIPHLMLFGKAGTGKTTLAKLLVKNIDCDHLYINASAKNKSLSISLFFIESASEKLTVAGFSTKIFLFFLIISNTHL